MTGVAEKSPANARHHSLCSCDFLSPNAEFMDLFFVNHGCFQTWNRHVSLI